MKDMKEEAGCFSAQCTRELTNGIPLCSCGDILIYKQRLHLLSTEKIDLFVHLSQPMSEIESNYDSGTDRQAITFLFSAFGLLLPLPPPNPKPLRLFLSERQ